MTDALKSMRRDYAGRPLNEDLMPSDPLTFFGTWFEEAVTAEVPDPNAMVLSTSGNDNIPSARVVLLKGVEQDRFVFYTNYGSKKADDLEENPRASLVFFWPSLARQVRIAGSVGRVSREMSEAYFSSRPRESQIGAWASVQSEEIQSRKHLEHAYDAAKKRFGDGPIPLPEQWGGFFLIPLEIEFWQGRPSRLHDRIVYRFSGDSWRMVRLSP